ncbi:MAG TPA: hypothetical protein VGZ22_19385 [Isosphaeraceae bacterium]|jgi:hypothetical protein|nr:hypothetical protein [Isosphaeraceae bacterium]
MLKGFYLTLLVGPVVPIPAPKTVVDSLTSVQVTTASGRRSGFQLTFTLSLRSPLHTIFLISGGGIIPIIRVILIVTVNGTPEVLIDGVMTNHQVTPSNTPGQATLTVTGEDLSAVMDWIDFSGVPYPAMPAEARVALIVAKYAMFGMIPLVIPSILIDVPIPTEEIPRHQGTDLQYIQKLADDVGYVFFVAPGPVPGTNIAYWGPDLKIGLPQPALNYDMDAQSNVESLSFTFDTQSKTLPVLFIQNLLTKIPIPIPVPDITPLSPPLGLIPPIPRRLEFIEGTSGLSPIQAALIGLAKASKSSDAVTATGSLDVLRYGRPLKARGLVGVRGVGPAYDGLYYVSSVTHDIKRGEYKQNFTLVRNGLVSTLPRVPT